MSRGESSGGGHSSLKYLFGSDENQPSQPPPPPKTVSLPPYGIDIDGGDGDSNGKHPVDGASSTNQVIDRSQGQHMGNILTDRPSTRVKSVPGGHSSLGYLFGDK